MTKTPFSIIFTSSVEGSNDKIKWAKLNLKLPPSVTPPTFQDLHNSFQALDTNSFRDVMQALDLRQYIKDTECTYGETDTRHGELVLTSDLIYYIK